MLWDRLRPQPEIGDRPRFLGFAPPTLFSEDWRHWSVASSDTGGALVLGGTPTPGGELYQPEFFLVQLPDDARLAAMVPSTPLTKRLELSPPYCLAISTASLIAALSGTSASCRSS